MTRARPDDDKERLLGAMMLAHFAVVCGIKIARSVPEEIWWISHISLAIAGGGLLAGSPLLRASALTNVFVLHSVWIVDCVIGLIFNVFPIGVANYMREADTWVWLGTVHHFYLLPVLLALQIRDRAYPVIALGLSAALFCFLTITSHFGLPPQSNVNYAFVIRFVPRNPIVIWANTLPPAGYLLALNVFVSVCIFFPTAVLFRRFSATPLGRPMFPVRAVGVRC